MALKTFNEFDNFVPMWEPKLIEKGWLSPFDVWIATLHNYQEVRSFIDRFDGGLFRAKFFLDELSEYFDG